MTSKEFVKALRDAADFFESRPELSVPLYDSKLTFNFCGDVDAEHTLSVDSIEGLKFFAKHVGGKIDKDVNDRYYKLVAHPSPNLEITALAYGYAVCHKVVVGKKLVPEFAVEAQPATVVPEHTEDVFAWECPTSILVEDK